MVVLETENSLAPGPTTQTNCWDCQNRTLLLPLSITIIIISCLCGVEDAENSNLSVVIPTVAFDNLTTSLDKVNGLLVSMIAYAKFHDSLIFVSCIA